MTPFALGALLLMVLAVALLRPAWRSAPVIAATRDRDARADAGPVGDDLASRASVASGTSVPTARKAPGPADSRRSAKAISLAVPIFAVALYAAIGNPHGAVLRPEDLAGSAAADNPVASSGSGADTGAAAAPEALQAMLATMAERLEKSPGSQVTDLAGWTLVARSYAALQRFADADRAYVHALALAPDDATLLADRADVLTVLQGGRSAGEPARLIERALQLEPANQKALALAGAAAVERNDLDAARRDWQQARSLAQPGSEFAADLDRSLAGLPGAGMAEDGQRAPVASVAPVTRGASVGRASGSPPARIAGQVSLSPALASRAAPSDTVFIYARAAEGPRMPLAVLRTTVAELPRDFTLDDSMAMSPQMKLSAYPRVVVGVRVSRSGSAAPQPGDLHGESAATDSRVNGLRIVVDQVQP